MVVLTNRNTYIIQQSPVQGKCSMLSVTTAASVIKFIIIIKSGRSAHVPRGNQHQTLLHCRRSSVNLTRCGNPEPLGKHLPAPLSRSLNLPPERSDGAFRHHCSFEKEPDGNSPGGTGRLRKGEDGGELLRAGSAGRCCGHPGDSFNPQNLFGRDPCVSVLRQEKRTLGKLPAQD